MIIGKPSHSNQLWTPNEGGVAIWEAVEGYFPYTLKEIFPADQSDTDKKKDLFRAVRGR
ncbi:MAG: hypothetical protein HY981_02760 [Candidatus Magasanikbacteria bacterium]|nr:hypothetical protein [Candidatus Magasanikbacteria bacterium]